MRSNTSTHYGSVAKTFHWLTALLMASVIPLGIFANDLPYETSAELARKAFWFSMHKTLGVTLFFVALARILWAISQPKPGLLNADRPLEAFAARSVHWLLYGSLVLVPLSGWVHHASSTGYAPIWWPFGQTLPFVPKDVALSETAAGLHLVFERVLILALVLHIAGALKHHFVDRDMTLRRMLPGMPALPRVAAASGHALPALAAIAVWGGAVGIGGALGVYAHAADTPRGPALEAVASDWVVQDGRVGLSVTQMGSEVTGQFAEWTAAISYDPQVSEGQAGEVDVTINVASLTLGSVTDQALGADFLAAEAHPTATFSGPIVAGPDGLRIEGTLALKGDSVPVTLPFTLEIDDGVAQARGRVTLDRRSWEIGMGQDDPSTLGWEVGVDITLTASRD